jgi:oxazoline/thiazoline dehydrogenase
VPDIRIRLKSRFRLAPSAGGTVCVQDNGAQPVITAPDQPSVIVDAMRAIATRAGKSARRLEEDVAEQGDVDALIRWHYLLNLCRDANAVEYDLYVGDQLMATAQPLRDGIDAPAPDAPDQPTFVMSRFAYLRHDRGRAVLESPLSPVRLVLMPAGAAVAARLMASGGSAPERLAQTGGAVMVAVRTALAHWGFMESPDIQEAPARQVWEFHDLLFHHGSRLTNDTMSVGATFRFRDSLPPWPALPPSRGNGEISLATPDLARSTSREASFADILDRRQSIRDGAATLTIGQLSELLFRTMRIRQVNSDGGVETMRRIAPSGGALYEIDAYLAVGNCGGLESGCYRYDGSRHVLEMIKTRPDAVADFLDQATRSWKDRHPQPDVLITLAARLPRIAWQYERMAYRIVLLNAGALIQTLYLVATAMRLAPCAVGNGKPTLFAALTGRDLFEETSVGEFALSGSVG